MAAYGPAVDRVKYLITGCTYGPRERNTSPATISGGPESIYSYRLRIAWKVEDNAWLVREPDSTPTTNRHIRAAGMALDELGFRESGLQTADYTNQELARRYVKAVSDDPRYTGPRYYPDTKTYGPR